MVYQTSMDFLFIDNLFGNNDTFNTVGFNELDYTPEQSSIDSLFNSLSSLPVLDDACYTNPPLPTSEIIEDEGFVNTTTSLRQSIKLQQQQEKELYFDLEWCLKNGKSKSQQYWVYCEESQNNFAKFSLQSSLINLTSKSCIMKDIYGNLYVVENPSTPQITALPFNNTSSISTFNSTELFFTSPSDFNITVKLVKNVEEPQHPHQGEAEDVQTTSSIIEGDYPWELNFPLNCMYKLNFRGRSEGWFKMECTLIYQSKIVLVSSSPTFMLNNPRLKKMKEHKLYTSNELKFMHIYSIATARLQTHVSISHWEQMGKNSGFENVTALLQNASRLFPQKPGQVLRKRKRKSSSKNAPPTKKQRIL
mmetsp:Transcript_21770/g.37174  ORF Transcript_21770/g.37174 Transcript_21770/m.37174 type:complete len:363 (-) Transcript_21770:41-1129(-)